MKTDSSVSTSGLIRALGPVLATAIVVGTVIGSGVFKKPQSIAENIPYFGLIATVWILGGVLAMLGALALAEVAVLFPKAGGNYVFLREAYGRLAGFLFGWVEFWIIRGASLAALATLFTKSFHAVLRELFHAGRSADLLDYWPQKFLTVAVIMGLALVNVRGVRWGGVLQLIITTVKVGSLLAIIALPFVVAAVVSSDSTAAPRLFKNLAPVWPDWQTVDFSIVGRFTTALLGVLWAYHGWMNIAPVAEEVRQPQRNIPLALFAGVGIVLFLYLGANLAYSLVLTPDEMKTMKELPAGSAAAAIDQPHDDTVAIGFCRRLLGPIGVGLAAAAVMCSVFGALNGNLLVGPRLLYAMGEDGLAPRALGAVHPRFHTPALAILVMAAWASLLVLGVAWLTSSAWLHAQLPERVARWLTPEKDHFDILTDFAMFGAVIFETMAVVSIFVFRWKLPDMERPYRCWGYPVVPALYVLLPALILSNYFVNQQMEALVGVGFIAVGAVVYYVFFGRESPL